ncbi:MAG: phosphoglucosamine mutase [Candidatus Paraimprobicoccus trichonymphae]|uniref:Phosphoglucosamine mutase n=1 Tax=Candidatus Paraimprobicoccus trichonymphae TaxID=3033793 RepID=A0AA48L1A3_9FIRM|nr:MAG: phosphoglucosamine mutase [Candidatus Paraimprobicoccus trichonymphae]
MKKYFGTDGIRGLVSDKVTCELALNVGRVIAFLINNNPNVKYKILVGKDTRVSSDMLSCSLQAGICCMGVDCVNLGYIPTPGVAYLTKKYNADIGIMISASHNSYEFNGIKIFDKNGYKFSDELEDKIEYYLENQDFLINKFGKIGNISFEKKSTTDYLEYLKDILKINHFNKFRVLLDCANGSASYTAEKLFLNLNFNFVITNDKPDGMNINKYCGSTDLGNLSKMVVEENFDLGIAFDGDADRCIMVDELGNIMDGDVILALCAKNLKKDGKLNKNTVVGTIATSMGFRDFCKENDISFISTDVGDRHILENMLKNDYNLGGEQSGHTIFLDNSITGDGHITALKLLEVLIKSDQKPSELNKLVKKYPIENLNFDLKNKNLNIEKIKFEAEKILDNSGRILIRKSGTEPVLRVIIESLDINKINLVSRYLRKNI